MYSFNKYLSDYMFNKYYVAMSFVLLKTLQMASWAYQSENRNSYQSISLCGPMPLRNCLPSSLHPCFPATPMTLPLLPSSCTSNTSLLLTVLLLTFEVSQPPIHKDRRDTLHRTALRKPCFASKIPLYLC